MTFAFELFDLCMILATKQEERERDVNEVEKGSKPALFHSESQEEGKKNSTTADHLYRGLDHS